MRAPVLRRRARPTMLAVVAAACLVVLGAGLAVPAAGYAAPDRAPVAAKPKPSKPTSTGGFKATHPVVREFQDAAGQMEAVSRHDVTVTASQTKDLRGRQRVQVSWSGAQPSGGRASNPYGENGLAQEYPVVVMQCRGVDDASAPAAQQLRPETCWTTSVAQRSQILRSESESTWTRDVRATDADRQRFSSAGTTPTAEECPDVDVDPYATHLTPFVGASGKVYPACSGTTMPPEAAVGAAFPPSEVAAYTDLDGRGSVQFEVRSEVENETLGCTEKVACSIVVVPIAGLSCAAPTDDTAAADRACRQTGRFAPGSSNFAGEGIDQAVSPALWWSASNWDQRFTIPITFGLPPDACDVLDDRAPTGFYGSELLAQAALQWSPAYCLKKDRFKFQLNQMSDDAGFTVMQSGQGPAAVVSSQHKATSPEPVAYAPTAVTGFGIGYVIDRPDNAGEYGELRLTPRLAAKLLTQSYTGSDLGRGHPGMAENPLAIMTDPEFVELNPGLSDTVQEVGATLLSLSISSDVVTQLTSWIAADKDAAAFVAGRPDPWGMVVNPSYRKIKLPRAEWPLLDTYVPKTQSTCRQQNPAVYFNQIAAPVTTMRKISEAVLDGWPNVQTRCDFDTATQLFKTGRVDRQSFGSRFVLGVVSLGDAARYGLKVASLETSGGRFVGPTEQALGEAVSLMKRKQRLSAFTLDQEAVAKDGGAYPGTMAVYTAARTGGVPAEDAAHVAQFVRVSTTEGQRLGTGNGQLPEGYLPVTKKGPTAKLYEAARTAADLIEAQKGDGPGGQPGDDDPATTDAAPGAGATTGGGTDLGLGGGTDGAPAAAPGAPGAAGAGAAPPSAQLENTSATAATSPTESVASALAGKLFPGLAVLALLALLAKAFVRYRGRLPFTRGGGPA